MVLGLAASPLSAMTAMTPLDVLDSCFVINTADGSTGTGFLIEGNRVITAAHVVGDAARVRLTTAEPNARTFTADVMITDPVSDVAVLRAPRGTGAVPLKVQTQPAQVGTVVFAIGSPIGDLVLSRGEVIALGDGRIEADAPVDPGSSGGPLVDGEGAVRGLVVEMSEITGNAFAVPAATFLEVADRPSSAPPPTSDQPQAISSSRSVPGVVMLTAIFAALALVVAFIALFVAFVNGRRSRPDRIVIRFED